MNTDEIKYPFFNKISPKSPFLPTISHFISQPFPFTSLPALRTSTPIFSHFPSFPPFPYFSLSLISFFPLFENLSCHPFSRPISRLIPTATDVLFFLTADNADERLVAETDRLPSLDCRNPPLSRTDCQRDRMNEFSSSASNKTTTCRRLFTRIRKPSLQAKRASISSIHIELKNRW